MVKVRITRREMLELPDEMGRLKKFYRVWFTIDNKIEDYIMVPEEEYGTERIKQKIEELAKKHKEIGEMEIEV